MVDILSQEFDVNVSKAVAEATRATLTAGVCLFYRDSRIGIDIMEQPDGRRFEIRYIPNAPGETNHEVVRELSSRAA
jgi:hypothetical protein